MPTPKPTFETVTLNELEHMTRDERDDLDFGVIGFRPDARVDIYNATEQKNSGVARSQVMNSLFFATVGQCMNNFMVAQRFEDEPELDEIVPFVLTLMMRPTPVRLRLLQASEVERYYVLIER